MRSASSTAILEIIQNQLISHNAKTVVKLEVDVDGSWDLITDFDVKKGVDWSESGKNQKNSTIALTPLTGEIKFQVYNEQGKYSTGSGTSVEDLFDNNTKIRIQAGYDVGDNLAEQAQVLNLNDISGTLIKSYFFHTAHSGGTVIIDSSSGFTATHFTDLFIPLYDSETYDDSTYSPDAYTVQTYDSAEPGFEQFNSFTVTANNTDGTIYWRTFDDADELGSSISTQWNNEGTTVNGTKTIDLDPDIINERFIQVAIIYDGITWGGGQVISDITVTIQSSIEFLYKSVYYLDTPSFDDPASPILPMVFCSGRDIWKQALETDINIADFSGVPIAPTDFIKLIADKCKIQYSATSIATITGFTNINWDKGFADVIKGNVAFEKIMQKIQPTGFQMYTEYDDTFEDNILFVVQKPSTLIADGNFSYRNYNNIGNNRKNADKILQRFTIITDSQIVAAEELLDTESISATGDTVFSWAGDAQFKRFEADLPANIRGTVVVTPTGATLTVTSITGTVVVELYGNKWDSTAPAFEGEAIGFNNQIDGLGNTSRSINPLMTSDAECASVALSFISSFQVPVQEAQGLRWPYINLLPEINDVEMLWRRFIADDNLYFLTKATHHWDRGKTPNEFTMFNLDDSGRNFSETSSFVYDDTPTPMSYDRGFLYDMGISTPISTDAEIDAASIIIRNTDME